MNSENTIVYNRAKKWQLILFPLNNTATNLFMLLMGYVSYLAVGGYGIAVVAVSAIATATRLFDAVTDPIVGFLVDKTETRFGKFRPVIILGYLIMLVSLILMYFVGVGSGVVTFTVIYLIYILGYTCQTSCTKAGQTCLTNDPEQRPVYSRCDAIYNIVMFAGSSVYVSNYLQPKYGDIGVAALQEFCVTILILAGICTALAVIALWSKDRKENFGLAEQNKPPRFSDLFAVMKSNRPLQMLIVAASTDKLASSAATNSAVGIMIFGIIIGNYAFSGKVSIYVLIPSIIIVLLGTRIAKKQGSKKALVVGTWLGLLTCIATFALFLFFDPTQISKGLLVTALFIIIKCLAQGATLLTNSITVPMIADCADYELDRSGKYISGMIGTIFSFVDKVISSFASLIVGVLLASIGYKTAMPQVGDPSSAGLFWIAMFISLGLPALGWLASLIAMKHYELDGEKMKEIQASLSKKKEAAGTAASVHS